MSGKEIMEALKKIAGTRPIPRDRIEAALFGYTEEEWQEMVKILKENRHG